MFVLKSKYDALKREAEANERSARLALSGYRQREDNMERELRRTQAAYRNVKHDLVEANAKLADLQKPKQDAGAQAFKRIGKELTAHVKAPYELFRDADFSALEKRILAYYGLTAPYGGTLQGACTAVYEGHAGDSGLQRHSIGDEYPFVVYGEEFKGVVKYRILDTRRGTTWRVKFDTSKRASEVVADLKKLQHSFDNQGRLILIPKE